MFEKVKGISINKVSKELTSKTENIVSSISDVVDDLGEASKKVEVTPQYTEKTAIDIAKETTPIAIDVDVVSQEENASIEFDVIETIEKKSAFDYLKEELQERSAEKKDFKDALKREEERLAQAREKAKNSNVLRKIKLVDNAYSRKEIARDEQALIAFKMAEKKRIDEARAKRGKEIAKKNKKPIAVTLASILAACCAFGGISTYTHNVAMAEDYNLAVSCIMSEQYSEAADVLSDLNYDDSESLYDYAYAQSRLKSYKGDPERMLNALSWIDDIENEEVKAQYNDACSELKLADEIQDDIDSINLTSAEDISKDTLTDIENLSAKLDERYRVLLAMDSYELATRVLYNVENNTDAGQLISDIDDLGEILLDSKDEINRLKKAYSNLSNEDKETILNYSLLTSAEKTYKDLKKKEDARIAAEKKAEEERIAAEKKAEEERQAKEAEEARLAAEAAASDTQEQLVWVSSNGHCYHSRSSCSNMKDPWQVTLSKAKGMGKRACKKCY